MTTAQLRQKENYDKHRKPDPNLESGDMVWFLPRNVKTTRPSKKLDYKKMGPFKIIKQVGTSSYKLDLPASMTIHNTFHISLLEPYEDNKFPPHIQTPLPPIEIDREPEYELEEIIHQQKNDLRPADATRVRTYCVRPMRPVRPDRPPNVFSHPMRLVPPNALIPPPMHPARLLRPPSVPTPPSSFPSSTALV